MPLCFFVVSECPAQCTAYNKHSRTIPQVAKLGLRSSDLPVGSETNQWPLSLRAPLNSTCSPRSQAPASPIPSRMASLHPCYGGGTPCIPKALIWLGHTENHGKVVIFEEKRLPWARSPHHSLCHTASCWQQLPRICVHSVSLQDIVSNWDKQ